MLNHLWFIVHLFVRSMWQKIPLITICGLFCAPTIFDQRTNINQKWKCVPTTWIMYKAVPLLLLFITCYVPDDTHHTYKGIKIYKVFSNLTNLVGSLRVATTSDSFEPWLRKILAVPWIIYDVIIIIFEHFHIANDCCNP